MIIAERCQNCGNGKGKTQIPPGMQINVSGDNNSVVVQAGDNAQFSKVLCNSCHKRLSAESIDGTRLQSVDSAIGPDEPEEEYEVLEAPV